MSPLQKNRKPIPRISAKRLEKLKAEGLPLPARTARQHTPVKKKNAKRAKANHARAYGGEYADWIRSLPCVACGSPGLVEAAHVRAGGIGYKSDAKWLVPLCGPFPAPPFTPTVEGCHRESHRGIKTFEKKYCVDLKAIAAQLYADYSAAAETLGAVAGGGEE